MSSIFSQQHSFDDFTDREDIERLFANIQKGALGRRLYVLAIKGNSGTGKTWLAWHLQRMYCSGGEWAWSILDFTLEPSVPTFQKVLNVLGSCLQASVSEEHWQAYQENYRNRQREALITIYQTISASGNATIANSTQIVDASQLQRNQQEHLRANLTEVLLELAPACEKPCCLYVDGYERFEPDRDTPPYQPGLVQSDLVSWFWSDLISELARRMPVPLLVVTCGWHEPAYLAHPTDPTLWSRSAQLEDFPIQHVQEYLHKVRLLPLPAEISSEEADLLQAFMDLTRGHPLVLGLAATYLSTMAPHERTAQQLQAGSSEILGGFEARTKFLHQRLLERLPEPHRTLLERGPLLRAFDQEALGLVLVDDEEKAALFDDRAYEAFLRYPFVNYNRHGGPHQQATFHEVIRRIQLNTVRDLHPQTSTKVHSRLAEYYLQFLEGWEPDEPDMPEGNQRYQRPEIPAQVFHALTEGIYHALQVPERQEETFEEWFQATELFIAIHRRSSEVLPEGSWSANVDKVQDGKARQLHKKGAAFFQDNQYGQAEAMLEIVHQLFREGCELVQEDSATYGVYLMLLSRFLTREARYDDARAKMQSAIDLFQSQGASFILGLSYQEMAMICRLQEDLPAASVYQDRALEFFRAEEQSEGLGIAYHNLALFAFDYGQLDQAERHQHEALRLFRQNGDRLYFAMALGNLGRIYHARQDLGMARLHYQQAMHDFEDQGVFVNAALYMSNLGVIYEQQGDLDNALQCYEDALERYKALGDLNTLALILVNAANIYNQRQQWDEALRRYTDALKIFQEEERGGGGEMVALMRVYRGLAYLYYQQKQWNEALAYCKQLLDLSIRRESQLLQAVALADLGQLYTEKQEPALALVYYQQLLVLFEQASATTQVAETHQLLAQTHTQLRDTEHAIEQYQQALKLFEQGDQQQPCAAILLELGAAYQQQRRQKEAQSCYLRAQQAFMKLGDMGQALVAQNKQGEIATEQGEWSRALLYYEQALSYFRRSNDTANLALTFSHLGKHQQLQGLREQALGFLQQALALQERVGEPRPMISTLQTLGTICETLGDEQKAHYYYERALHLSQQNQDSAGKLTALIALGQLSTILSDRLSAREYLARVLENQSAVGVQGLLALAHYHLGEIEQLEGRLEPARACYQQAQEIWLREHDQPRLALVYVRLGQLLVLQQEFAPAKAELEQALQLCQEVAAPLATLRAWSTLGEILEHQGHATSALECYKSALEAGLPATSRLEYTDVIAAIGMLYFREHQFEQASSWLYQALCAYEFLGRAAAPHLIATLQSLLACYTALDDQDRYQAYHNYLQRKQQELQNTRGIA